MKQHAKRASWARVLLVPTLLLGSASMAAFPVHAAQVELNQTVTLQMRKVKLADVFKKLSNLSGYEFFYDESVVQKYNMIDIDLDNVSFDQALEQIRKQTSLQLSKVNNTIVVSLAKQVLASSGKVQASRHRVTGRVTDANNEPLIGVSIVIQGNSGGTITLYVGRSGYRCHFGLLLHRLCSTENSCRKSADIECTNERRQPDFGRSRSNRLWCAKEKGYDRFHCFY